jgi:hypothetical protein
MKPYLRATPKKPPIDATAIPRNRGAVSPTKAPNERTATKRAVRKRYQRTRLLRLAVACTWRQTARACSCVRVMPSTTIARERQITRSPMSGLTTDWVDFRTSRDGRRISGSAEMTPDPPPSSPAPPAPPAAAPAAVPAAAPARARPTLRAPTRPERPKNPHGLSAALLRSPPAAQYGRWACNRRCSSSSSR